MEQDTQVAYLDRLVMIANGDKSAALFLEILGRVIRIADDLVDEEPKDFSTTMADILYTSAVELQLNDFFSAHKNTLMPAIGSDILMWDASNEWKKSDIEFKQMFGYVNREAINVYLIVAMICGGYEHAKTVLRKIGDHTVSKGETFKEWLSEPDALKEAVSEN